MVCLCVTNTNVRDVNIAAISRFVPPITEEALASHGNPRDPNVCKGQKIVVRRGLTTIRCTEKINKRARLRQWSYIPVMVDVLEHWGYDFGAPGSGW